MYDPSIFKAARVLAGWTQEHLADQAGISVTAVAHLENEGRCHLRTYQSVVGALERAGIVLDSSGVRITKQETEHGSRPAA